MEIILLERVEKLGAIGDVVTVKDGYARNFLIPGGRAKRATDARTSADPSASPDAVPPHTSASVVECAAPPAFPFALRFSVPSADEAMHRGDDANDQTTECMTQRAARLGCPPNSDEASHAAWPVTYPGGALYALWEGAVADAVLEVAK